MDFNRIEKVRVCEVGLRDGLQNEETMLCTRDKISLVNAMTEAGFPVIEVGSFVRPSAVPQMADTDEVFRRITRGEGVEYRALIANVRGVERAVSCGCQKVKLNVSASTAHNLANLNCTPTQSIKRFAESAALAYQEGIEISGSISMPFGSPWEREVPLEMVWEIVDAYLDAGITELSLSDASGMGCPTSVACICGEIHRRYPQVTWWFHFHNTRGLGLANILVCMQHGFSNFDASFAGLGGCPFVPGAAGNVTTEDLINMCMEMGIETGVNLDHAIAISRYVTRLVGHGGDSYILRAGKCSDLLQKQPTGQIKNHTLVDCRKE